MNHDDHHSEQPDRDPAGDPDLPTRRQTGDGDAEAGDVDAGAGDDDAGVGDDDAGVGDAGAGVGDAGAGCAVGAGAGGVTVPFGLPVLAELPELAGLLEDLVAVDRLLVRVLDTLVLLDDTGQVEAATGVGVGQWLAIVARRTGSDVRMLRCAVRACRRLPALFAGFRDGRLSWAQLRVVALKVDRAPQHTDLALDAKVADAIDTCRDAEPDALARMVGWAIAELADPPEDRPAPTLGEGFFHLQPRLDGTGGTVFGDLDAYSFALLDAATAPTQPPAAGPTRTGFAGPTDPVQGANAARTLGRQRLARLLDHLAHRCPDTAKPADRSDDGAAGDGTDTGKPADRPHGSGADGTAVADRIDSDVDSDVDDNNSGDATGAPGGAGAPAGRSAAVKLLLRAELDTLLGNSHLPSQLLTTLAGGAMHLDAQAARRLADAGVQVRLIVTDRGRIVGVGRQSRVPPGWLRDATLALHDTCTAPGCERAALAAHTDHAVPWDAGGHTDIGNCGPLCGHDNHHKERSGWKASGQPDGTRHWHHPRSGLKITTHPTTKRPPPRPNHPPDHERGGGGERRDAAPPMPSSTHGSSENENSGSGGREPPRHPPPEHPPDS
jgi:hypothetical protein